MRSPPKAHEYGSRQQQPVTSRSRRPRSTAPAPPGANAPKPRLAAIPVVVASTSHRTHSRTRLGDLATRSRCAVRKGSRSAQLYRPSACAPDIAGDARPPATTAEPQPTSRHLPQTVMAPPTPPIVDHTYRKTSPPTQTPLHSETGSKSRRRPALARKRSCLVAPITCLLGTTSRSETLARRVFPHSHERAYTDRQSVRSEITRAGASSPCLSSTTTRAARLEQGLNPPRGFGQ